MRLAVDARELAGRPTGVGRYLAELLWSWSRDAAAAADTITLFAPAPLTLPTDVVGTGGAAIRTVALRGGRGLLWEQATLPWALRQGADVLLSPAYSLPLCSPVPAAVTMHDVSFCAHPEWFRTRERLRRRWTAALSARRAARIFTVSEFSRGEIARWLRVPSERIVVTPNGPGRRHAPAADGRPAPPREPLVLYVGSILNRRHVPTLIRAFAPLAARLPEARLAIVGDNRSYPHQDLDTLVRSLGLGERVQLRAFVEDAELGDLYQRASAFAFLSEYEGFGLTPLEAMAAGVPVVAADTPAAREVYGDAARLVPAGDEAATTGALASLLTDPAVRAQLLEAAAVRLGRWSWDTTARRTLETLREVAAS